MALVHEENHYLNDDNICLKFRTSKFRGSLKSQLCTEVMVYTKDSDSNNYTFNSAENHQRDLLVTRAGRVTKEMIQKHRDFITGSYSKIIAEFQQNQQLA